MASVIKSNSAASLASPVIFSFEDAAQHASRCIEEAQAQAAAIIAEAQRQAKQISLRSQQDGQNAGWRSAERAIDEKIAQKMESLLPALQKTIADLGDARQAWLRHWEQTAVHLAAKIAQRIIRREISQKPQITLDLVREALQLAAGSPKLKIALHPDDFDALHGQVDRLINEIASAAEAEIVPDIAVSLGGCRVETRHGLIDQQIETQLERVIAELTGGND
jgi:flagellar biosynthesis/type III secretory pathway protein FliH